MARRLRKEDVLLHPLRRELLAAIAAQPGITMKELASLFDRRPSTIQWHATKLSKADLVRSERVGEFRVFYAAGEARVRAEALARPSLADSLARRIHEAVVHQPGITVQDLVASLMGSAPSIRWHLRRLLDSGLVCAGARQGRICHYYPNQAIGTPCLQSASA